MRIAKAFDDLVGGYSEKIMRWVPNYQRLLAGIFHILPPNFKPVEVLELGCGNGNLSSLIFHQYPTVKLTAVDVSEEMIATTRERFAGQAIHFQCNLIQDCEFSDRSFDLIVAVLALHHLDAHEKQALFKNAHNWLRPGGYLCISDLCIAKSDRPFHDQHLTFWQAHSAQMGCNKQEWLDLMEHYETFDKPDDWLQQLKWLKVAGFSTIDTPFRKLGWTTIQAKKE